MYGQFSEPIFLPQLIGPNIKIPVMSAAQVSDTYTYSHFGWTNNLC